MYNLIDGGLYIQKLYFAAVGQKCKHDSVLHFCIEKILNFHRLVIVNTSDLCSDFCHMDKPVEQTIDQGFE